MYRYHLPHRISMQRPAQPWYWYARHDTPAPTGCATVTNHTEAVVSLPSSSSDRADDSTHTPPNNRHTQSISRSNIRYRRRYIDLYIESTGSVPNSHSRKGIQCNNLQEKFAFRYFWCIVSPVPVACVRQPRRIVHLRRRQHTTTCMWKQIVP